MSMKVRVILAVLLLTAVSTQQSVFAEVSDPTTETWTHPTRISPISGLEEYNGDSELFFYNSAWYIALSSLESTIFTTVDESGYLAQSYVLLENEVAPRIVDHNDMMYISTIRVTEHNWELVLRSTFDGVNWLSENVIHFESDELPMDYDLDISSEGTVHAVWSVTEGNNRGLTHFVYESAYDFSLTSLDVDSRGAFTSEHSPSVEWRDGCLYVTWISNQFKPPAQHAGIEHEEVVFAIQCDGVFSPIVPMSSTFTVDSDPFFISHADEPMVAFSSVRQFNQEFDSEFSSFSNIWLSNLFDEKILHQLPTWNTDEYNPSGSFGDDKLGMIWHDHTGVFISFSSLEFDNSDEFTIPNAISTTPSEIDMTITTSGFIDEIVIENIGQVEVTGELRCSENLVIQKTSFRLQPGESVSFWVQFSSELAGKYVEEITVISSAGNFDIPVKIEFEGDIGDENPEIPEAGPVVETNGLDEKVDFTIIGVIAILAGLLCLFVFANKSLQRRTSMGLAVMVVVMIVTPLSNSMMAKADLYYDDQELNSNDDYQMIAYETPNQAEIGFFNEPENQQTDETLLTYPALPVDRKLLSSSQTMSIDVFEEDYPSYSTFLQACSETVDKTVQGLDHDEDGEIGEDEIVYQKFTCLNQDEIYSTNTAPSITVQDVGMCHSGSGAMFKQGFDQNYNNTLDDEEVLSIEVNCDHPRYSEYYIDPLKFELNLPYPIVNLTFGGIDERGNKDVWLHIYDKTTNQEELIQIVAGNTNRNFIETNSWGVGLTVPTSGTLLDTRYGGDFDLMLFSTLTEGSSYIYGDQLLVKSQKAADRIQLTSVREQSQEFSSQDPPICASDFTKNVSNSDKSFVGNLICEAQKAPQLFERESTYPFQDASNNVLNLELSDSSLTNYTFNYQLNNQYPLVEAKNPLGTEDIVFMNNGNGDFSIEYRDKLGDEITRGAVTWSNAMNANRDSIRNNIELTLGIHPPIINNLLVNNTDRFYKFEDQIPIHMGFHNPYDRTLSGEVKITAIDLTTSTLHSAVKCFDQSIPAQSDITIQFDISPSMQIGACRNGDTGMSKLYPDHTYFLVADFIPDPGMESWIGFAGKSMNRYGANATNVMSEEIASSMFTVTFGDVISNVRIIHEDYRLAEYDSNKIYILNAFDASSTLMMDTNLLSLELYETYRDDYDVEFINSTQAFQEVVQSAEYGSTVINLMGDSIPIPRNYLTIPLGDDQYLGNWNIEGFSATPTSIQDNSRYNNPAELFGNPVYTSRHQYGVSSILFDGDGDYASVRDSEASVICDSSTNLCYLSLGGVQFSKQNARAFNNYTEAVAHAPSGLFAIQDEMQFHVSFLVEEFNENGSNLIASYGHNPNEHSGWKLYVDPDGTLSFSFNLIDYSTPIVLSTIDGTISQNEWYSVYVNLENNKLSLLVNGEAVTLDRNQQNPYSLAESDLHYVSSDDPNKGLLIAGWSNTTGADQFQGFTFANILVDKLSIADEVVELNSVREPSEQDYERAQYWLSIFASYVSESNINFVNLGPSPFKFVSNDASDWERKRLDLHHHGFDSMLSNYSLPAAHDNDCIAGPLTWTTNLDWGPEMNSNVFALEETSYARKSMVSESLLTNGDPDQGCSVVERYPFGDGAITQVNLDFSNPLYIEQSIGSIVDVVNATIEWNPEVVYVFNVRQKTSCEVVSSPESYQHEGVEKWKFNLNSDCVERSGIFGKSVTSTSSHVDVHRSNGEVIKNENMRFVKEANGLITAHSSIVMYQGDRLIFDASGISAESDGMVSLLNIDQSDQTPGGQTQSLTIDADSKVFQDQELSGGSGTGGVTADVTIAKNGAKVNSIAADSWSTPPPLQFESGTYLLAQQGATAHDCRVDLVANPLTRGVVTNVSVNQMDSFQTWADSTQTGIATTSANGTGLSLDLTFSPSISGIISSLSVTTEGTGFNSGETSISGTSVTVNITADAISGAITSVSIVDGGSGYSVGDTIQITSPTGVDAVVEVSATTQSGGLITDVQINDGGSGYAISDEVSITHGTSTAFFDVVTVGSVGGEFVSMALNSNAGCENDYSYTYGVNPILQNFENEPILPIGIENYPISVGWVEGIIIQDISITDSGDGYVKGDYLEWAPSPSSSGLTFSFRVDSISNLDNANLVDRVREYDEIGQFRFVEINEIDDFDQMIMSNVENSMIINYNSQGTLPMPDRYITGAQPQLLSSALFNFELIKIGFLEVSPSLSDYPEQHPVEVVISYDSGVAERFEMITQPRTYSTEEVNNYTWMPLRNNLQMTTAILASQINNHSSHLTAVAANNIISLQLRPDVKHTPSNIQIDSTNEQAIIYTEYDLLEPVDTSTHREKGTVSGEGYYWTDGIFDNTGLGLKHGSKFNTTFDATSHMSLDFWMTISSAHSLTSATSATEPVATLQCLDSDGTISGKISLLEHNFADLAIGKPYPISLSLSDFKWTDSTAEDPPYYVNRVKVTSKTTHFEHSSKECTTYRFEISPTNKLRNVVIDHVHAIQDPNIGILNEIDIDVEGYLADFGDFFAHNKNTLALDFRQPFTHISLSMDSPLAEIYTDISIQKPLAPVICILGNDSIYITEERCVTDSRPIQTIPEDHPGAVPVCINDYEDGDHVYYAGYESCFGSRTRFVEKTDTTPAKMLFEPVNQKMVIHALDSGVKRSDDDYCGELNASNSGDGHFVCMDELLEGTSHGHQAISEKMYSSDNHLLLPADTILLSGLNRLFPDELPPLYDIHEAGVSGDSTYDFDLRTDLFEFQYESGFKLPSTPPKIQRSMDYGLFSPTNLDWMYSVYQNETTTGSYVGPGMFDIHSGSIVLADTSFTDTDSSMELIAQLLWSSRQNHRLLHVMPDLNGEISIDSEELEILVEKYRDLGYIQITDRTFTPNDSSNVLRLYDALDGIYGHGGDDKILVMSNPSSVVMPKMWYSEIKTSDAIGFRANMDLVDNIDKLHYPYVKIPFSEGYYTSSSHDRSGQSDYKFTIKSNSIQDLFVELDAVKSIGNPSSPEWYFWNGLPDSKAYDAEGIIQTGNAPLFSVYIHWNAIEHSCHSFNQSSHQPLVDVVTITIDSIPNNCDGVWSLEFTLEDGMRKSYTRSLLSADILKIEKANTGSSSFTDVTSTFSDNFEGILTYDGSVIIDEGIGFESSSVKVLNVDEGFNPAELGLMFNHWMARNGHCLVLATNDPNPNFLFSEVGFMKSDQYATTVVDNLVETYDDGSTFNSGFASFSKENTGGLDIGVVHTTSQSVFTKTHGAFYDEPITESVDHSTLPKSSRYSYVKTTSSKHMHEFVGMTTEDATDNRSKDVAIRAFVPIQRGGIVFAGDGDLSSAMSFALLYSTQEHAVRQRLGIFTKGETISLDVTIDLSNYPEGEFFESTYLLSGRKDANSPISEVVVDSEAASLPTGEAHSILLSWSIPSSMPIGFASLRVDAIDTVLDRKTSTWGDGEGESLGFRIESLMYIIDIETPLMVGAFDDADINVIVYNDMNVENLIDVSVYLTHGRSAQPISFETQQPANCAATSRCKVRLRWDATSNYAGQTREVGTYEGRAYIDDHVTRYQVINKDNQNPVQKPAIIDSQVFEIDIHAQLEIVLPGESSKWRVKFGDGPWEMYNGGEIIRKFASGSEFQIQPVGDISNKFDLDCYVNNDTAIHNSLTIRYLAKSDSPSYLLYHIRTDDQSREEPGCGANENRKIVVDKFKMDGTTYSIPMDGLEQNAMITVSTELLYNMGSISLDDGTIESIGNFDNWTSTQYPNKMIKLEDASKGETYYGYYSTIEIFDGADGWYSFTWPDAVSGVYSAVINLSDFTPGFAQAGGNAFVYSFDKDTSTNELPYHGDAVGDKATNFFVPAGKFVVFLGSSEWGAVSDLDIDGIQFGKGHAVNLKNKAACPFANYDEAEYNEAVSYANSLGIDCPPYGSAGGDSSTAPTLPVDDTGMTMQNVPQAILNILTDNAHLPMPSVQADASKSKLPMSPEDFGIDILKIGWEENPFASNLRVYIKIPFVGSFANGAVNYKAVIELEIFLSVRFFEKYCLAPPSSSSSGEPPADVDPYCLQEILAVPNGLETMLLDIPNFIGWWSTLTLEFDIDIGRYIPAFQAFQQFVYADGFECVGATCNSPAVQKIRRAESDPIFSREMHLYLFFGFEIGLVNNVAACSPIYYGTGMSSRNPSAGDYFNHALNDFGETVSPTETGERFAAIMTRAQAETGICPPSMNYQIDPDRGSPQSVNFQIGLAVGVEWVLEIDIRIKNTFKSKMLSKFVEKESEASEEAAKVGSQAAKSLKKANEIRAERAAYCETMMQKVPISLATCKQRWTDTNPKSLELDRANSDVQDFRSKAEAAKKEADDQGKNKKKFGSMYNSPFMLKISFTVKVGVFFGLEVDCLSGQKHVDGPMCTVIMDLEFVFQAKIKLEVQLFKICIFGWCWTPTISVSLSVTLDKVIYVNMIGFKNSEGKDPDGGGKWLFCDRASGFAGYNELKYSVHSAVNKFSFGKKELIAIKDGKLKAGTSGDSLIDDIEGNEAKGIRSSSKAASVATFKNSEVSLKIMFFEIKAHIPDAGC